MTTPNITLASRIGRVSPSPTLAVTSLAKKLIAQGKDVISFGAGEPDFGTPARITKAAQKALDEGRTKYAPVPGLPALRNAIADQYNARGFSVSADNIVVSPGAKYTLYEVFQVLLDPGDEVIIPAPYWVSYPAQVLLADGKPVMPYATHETGFKLTPQALRDAITPRTKALVLNSPSNPTGAVYSKDELNALADVVLEHNIAVIYDAIYARLVYGDAEFTDFALLRPGLEHLTITVDGLSKSHAMTGWRVGFLIAPTHIAKAVSKLQSQSTSGLTTFVQYASIEAVQGDQPELPEMHGHFDRRRILITELLNDIPSVVCEEPHGAFYAFPNFSAFLGHTTPAGDVLENDLQLVTYLLEEHGVALVHGSAFGAPGFARLSYATSDEAIREGVSRIAKGLAALSA